MLAIVGPGRVGQALGRRLREGGVPLLGFLGRDAAATRAAVAFAGGEELAPGDLGRARLVMLAVQDDQLAGAVGEVAAALPGAAGDPVPVCFHTSGAHDLAVLAPLAGRGLGTGSLHPVCPLPDVATGYRNLPGQPAVLAGAAPVLAELEDLARRAGLEPVVMAAGDRLLYHTACVLAANGLTALFERLEQLFGQALEQPGAAVRRIPAALMQKALASSVADGAIAALSGPVARGDAALIGRQLQNLARRDAELAMLYRLLMRQALAMVASRGDLDPDALAKVRDVLDAGPAPNATDSDAPGP